MLWVSMLDSMGALCLSHSFTNRLSAGHRVGLTAEGEDQSLPGSKLEIERERERKKCHGTNVYKVRNPSLI